MKKSMFYLVLLSALLFSKTVNQVQAQEDSQISRIASFQVLRMQITENGEVTFEAQILRSDGTVRVTAQAHIIKNDIRRTVTTNFYTRLAEKEVLEIRDLLVSSNFEKLHQSLDELEIPTSPGVADKPEIPPQIFFEVRLTEDFHPVLGDDLFWYQVRPENLDKDIKPLFRKILQVATRLDNETR